MVKEQEVDGGRAALGGFLYQLIATPGLVAWAEVLDDLPAPSPQLTGTFRLLLESIVTPELYDQDAVIQPRPSPHDLGLKQPHDCTLVQFKYSLGGKRSTIGQQEYLDIILRLSASTNRAKKDHQRVTGYLLVTNRELGPTAKQIERDAQAGKPIVRTIGKKTYTLTKPQITIVKQLLVTPPIKLEAWQKALMIYADQLGCEWQDINRGISSLVHQLMYQVVDGPVPITTAMLHQAFTGEAQAQRLICSLLVEETRKRLDITFLDQLGLHGKRPFRRKLLDDIDEQVKHHALIVLYGDGGCGKTVALWQWTHEALNVAKGNKAGIATMLPAHQILETYITHKICDWGHLSKGHPWRADDVNHERALQRLCRANPQVAHPIFCLGLDELDATKLPERDNELAAVLVWFWEQEKLLQETHAQHPEQRPIATLIVTCREISDLSSKIASDQSQEIGYELCALPVTDFLGKELPAVAAQLLPDSLASSVAAAAPELEQGVYSHGRGRETTLLPSYAMPVFPISPQVLKVLEHPAMWDALLSLKDEAAQKAVLTFQPEALTHLAEKFIGRFCRKAIARGQKPADDQTLRHILAVIAIHCQNITTYTDWQRYRDWIQPACNEGLGYLEAEKLFKEARLAGLIIKQAEEVWIWHHPFVTDYLCSSIF